MLSQSRILRRRGCGIVGLPNIGKSTFFNALTCSQKAATGNYPFCTIDANLAKAKVMDHRLEKLAAFAGSKTLVPVELDVADVAGLIEGASKGAGLGNKFLNDIRPCNIVLHMVRCFESAKDGFDRPDPLGGISVIENELILADLESIEKKLAKLRSRKNSDAELIFVKEVQAALESGKSARLMKGLRPDQEGWLKDMQLLSAKPVLFVLNVDEFSMEKGNEFSNAVADKYGAENTLNVCSVIEEQTSQLSRAERLDFLAAYGVTKPQSEAVLERVQNMLKLQTFFTIGPEMAHAWSIPAGTTARQAAGEIHGDFEKHFVSASIVPWDTFITAKNLAATDKLFKSVPASHVMPDGAVFLVDHRAPK